MWHVGKNHLTALKEAHWQKDHFLEGLQVKTPFVDLISNKNRFSPKRPCQTMPSPEKETSEFSDVTIPQTRTLFRTSGLSPSVYLSIIYRTFSTGIEYKFNNALVHNPWRFPSECLFNNFYPLNSFVYLPLHLPRIDGLSRGGRIVELMLMYHSLPKEPRVHNLQVQVARPVQNHQVPHQTQQQHQQPHGRPLQHNKALQLQHPRMQTSKGAIDVVFFIYFLKKQGLATIKIKSQGPFITCITHTRRITNKTRPSKYTIKTCNTHVANDKMLNKSNTEEGVVVEGIKSYANCAKSVGWDLNEMYPFTNEIVSDTERGTRMTATATCWYVWRSLPLLELTHTEVT